jgi:hypothetical protein
MYRDLLPLALCAALSPALGACDVFYFAHARVPLIAPVDTTCLRSTLARGTQHRLRHSVERQLEGGRAAVVAYTTEGLFNNRWETVTQVVRRDSSVHRGSVYRDSSASLGASVVQVNRRFPPTQGPLTAAELARFLLDVRDACGGRSPGGERLFSLEVSETPYSAWVVRGTGGRVSLRLTVEGRRYWIQMLTRNAGRYVLHADTLSDQSEPRFPSWLEADTMTLPSPSTRTTVATECWRGDSLPTGDLVALARETDTKYLTDVLDAWALDRTAVRIRPVPVDGVECSHGDWGILPDAPRALRSAALTFRPAPGMARIYAYLSWPDVPIESAMPSVAVDSQIVGRLEGGSFLMVEVEPGRHRVSAPDGRHESVLQLDAAPDSAYFVELRTDKLALSWHWRAKVRPMDPAKARAALRRAHMVPSSWPGAPMGSRE